MASAEKVGEQTVELVRAERGRFAPGNPGGPGRPKRGVPIGEQFRRSVDWEAVRARLERIATGEKSKDADAIAAARELLDRAYGRPLASHELHVSGEHTESEYDVSRLSLDERRELLAKVQALRTGHQPDGVTDDNQAEDVVPCHERAT